MTGLGLHSEKAERIWSRIEDFQEGAGKLPGNKEPGANFVQTLILRQITARACPSRDVWDSLSKPRVVLSRYVAVWR